MDLLKKEMERKRKALAAAKGTSSKSSNRITASTLRRQQETAEEQLKKETAAASKQDSSTKSESRIAEHVNNNSKGEGDAGTIGSTNETSKSMNIVKRTLRSWGLPIRFFAESDAEIRKRYETARSVAAKQELAVAEADEFRLHAGHGMRNRFLEQQQEQETESSTLQSRKKRKVEEIDESIQSDPHKLIYRYLKNILITWENDLDSRPESQKQTMAGKKDFRTFQQCKDYIKPLFQLCKKRSIEPAMLSKLEAIIRFMQNDEFVKAHDAYMDLAIGRAAWPIGVTMVGIHARSGRAKIESSNVAHVMNSELQRKYLTSVKRLMTYQQESRTDVAPSKKVS